MHDLVCGDPVWWRRNGSLEAHDGRKELENGREQLVREVEQLRATVDSDWSDWLAERHRPESARRGACQLVNWAIHAVKSAYSLVDLSVRLVASQGIQEVFREHGTDPGVLRLDERTVEAEQWIPAVAQSTASPRKCISDGLVEAGRGKRSPPVRLSSTDIVSLVNDGDDASRTKGR